MKKFVSVFTTVIILTLTVLSVFIINVSADSSVLTFYNWDASYPAGVETTKPYTGTVSKDTPKTVGDESKPFTGTIVEEEEITSSSWTDGKFTGTENDVATQKTERDESIADNTRPGKVLTSGQIGLIIAAVVVVLAAAAVVVGTITKNKGKKVKTEENQPMPAPEE